MIRQWLVSSAVSALALVLASILVPASLASGVTTQGASALAASGSWDLLAREKNACDRRQHLRKGRYNSDTGKGWGWRKMNGKHNIRHRRVWRKVVRSSCGVPEGGVSTTYIYTPQAFQCENTDSGCEVTRVRRLKLVQQTLNNKGAITLHCVGSTRCPDWVSAKKTLVIDS